MNDLFWFFLIIPGVEGVNLLKGKHPLMQDAG